MPLTVHAQFEATGAAMAGRRALLATARRAARAALAACAVRDAEISITLVDDATIAELNAAWLRHHGPTDVISFPLHQDGEAPLGDVYLGMAQASRQAVALGVPLKEEVARLAIHGTLHVLGMDHPAGRGREKSAMWQLQEQILATLMGT
jgi:probable rRNA maturation factor